MPKRRWWRRWVCLPLLVFMLGVALYAFWWHAANRRLERQLELARRDAPPLTLAEMLKSPTLADRDATVLYQQALAELPSGRLELNPKLGRPLVDSGSEQGQRLLRLDSLLDPMLNNADFRRQHADDCRDLLRESAKSLELARKAWTTGRLMLPADAEAPGIEQQLPVFGSYRSLAKTHCLAALAAHEAGDDDAAVAHLEDAFALADVMRYAHPHLRSHLAAIAMGSYASLAIEEVSPSLKVGGAAGAAKPAAVRALLNRLLDERPWRDGLCRGLATERWILHDSYQRIRDGRMSFSQFVAAVTERPVHPTWIDPALRLVPPMVTMDEARSLEHMNPLVLAARETTLPTARAKVRPYIRPSSSVMRWSQFLTQVMTPTLERVHDLHFAVLAQRRMAAITLALRLHELDTGRRAIKLDELAGKYLPALPPDPLSASGAGFGYLPQGKPSVLYSVGDNGVDDGGSYIQYPTFVFTVNPSPDEPFFLDGRRPRPMPSWLDPTTQPWRR